YRRGGGVLRDLYWSLISLNHRGQQSHGFAILRGGITRTVGLGPLPDEPPSDLQDGAVGVGHVRYATSGGSSPEDLLRDAQPVIVGARGRRLALAYNGNVANAVEIRRSLESSGFRTSTGSDAELLALELLRGLEGGGLRDAMLRLSARVDGAYSIVGLTEDGTLFAARDPNGIRPLFLGAADDLVLVASETVALDMVGVSRWDPVAPGELLVVRDGNVSRARYAPGRRERLCSFEYAYFARPDSVLGGRYVYEVRRELGRRLAARYRDVAARVDVVAPVPETAVDAAYGFHEASGKPMEMLVFKHRFVRARAFMSTGALRPELIARKYNVSRRAAGRRIALMDDSIVRGDTLRRLVAALRGVGAAEIHVFSTFPRISHPCFYGVDMATYGELIGFNRGPEEVARELGADSVNYQDLDDFLDVVGRDSCVACVTGRYPTERASALAEVALRNPGIRSRITEAMGRWGGSSA
ncbi:MAG: amidophosphoribosyltransferase, partial [Conexivisphaera sp.]